METLVTVCLESFSDFPLDRQQGIVKGLGGYQPSKANKLAVIQDYGRIILHLILKNSLYTASLLWHNDLHSDNIFVN